MLNQQLSRSFEGATGGRPRRSGARRTLRAQVRTLGTRGGFGLKRPAGNTTRKRDSSRDWEHRANAAQVDRPGARGRARTRKNAAVERREASTRRNRVLDASLGVQAVPVWRGQGAGDPAPSACRRSTPLVFEGTKKEAHPARFEAA